MLIIFFIMNVHLVVYYYAAIQYLANFLTCHLFP